MRISSFNQSMVVGGVLALFGAGALLTSFEIPLDLDGGFGARTFPVMAAGALFILGLIEVVSGIRQVTPNLEKTDKKILVQVLLLLAVSLFYVWAMDKVGYLISTALTAPIVLLLFGVRKPKALIIATILCPIAYHLIFFVGLGVFPPYGEWFDILNVLEQ